MVLSVFALSCKKILMPLARLLLLSSEVPTGEWHQILADFSVRRVSTLTDAFEALSTERMDCALVAGTLPGLSFAEVLETLQPLDTLLPFVFQEKGMTAADAVCLIRLGAYHCFGASDSPEALRDCLERAAEEMCCREKTWNRGDNREAWRRWLVGESAAMQDVENTIRLVGARRCTVLIAGETGTGKEMAARALHAVSPRAHLPMVAVNCSALPENLLEAELFGHVKGAFTGAVNHRVGRFEQAHRSTLFLDEIGDMPIELQAKLLRVLQEREIQRLGSAETVRVDVRVVAASNGNLPDLVRQGRFREDLYYRLNVVPLQMPPLRQRRGDIPLLVRHFVKKICDAEGLPVKNVAPDAMHAFEAAPWPGNVRQLENTVEMAVVLSGDRDYLNSSNFGFPNSLRAKLALSQFPAPAPVIHETLDFETAVTNFERTLLESAMQKTKGNKTTAAGLLGMKRTTLIMKLRSLGTTADRMAFAG
jgi:DNA-binding NtrC family response regulator